MGTTSWTWSPAARWSSTRTDSIERRSEPLTARLAWLVGLLQGCQDLGPEEPCERILAAAGDHLEDDVALLVLRVDQ